MYFVTIEENEDQYSRNLDKPPTATTSKPNCTRSFTISMTFRKGETIFTGIMNKISQKDGGSSLKIKHVLANVCIAKIPFSSLTNCFSC